MSNHIDQIIAHIPLFQALDDEQRRKLMSGVSTCRLNKGEVLFRKGDPVQGFYIVVFGQIKLAVRSPENEEKVVEIIGPHQSLGEAVMFLGRPYPVNAEALCDSLLIHVATSRIDATLEQDSSFARRMLAGLSIRLHSLIQDVENYSLRSSAQRLIDYLLQHCHAAPSGTGKPDSVDVVLPASKQIIASRLNLTPETLSRILAELSRAGLIDVEGRTVTVRSPDRLREYQF